MKVLTGSHAIKSLGGIALKKDSLHHRGGGAGAGGAEHSAPLSYT